MFCMPMYYVLYAIHSITSISWGEKLYIIISIANNLNPMTDTSGNAAFSERGLQRHLGSETRTVHREHVRRCWPQLLRQKVYCGGQSGLKLGSS